MQITLGISLQVLICECPSAYSIAGQFFWLVEYLAVF